ncbi:MAG: hypothetical protein RLZZ70_654 [Candidatus Parcubacteria bacterium]|jgi:hypothetical protein
MFQGFTFVPDGESAAVLPNSEAIARKLGYAQVDQAAIAALIVYHDGVEVFRGEVEDGMYRSAIFVEAWMAYRGYGRGQTNTLVFDTIAILALERYVGNRVWTEASDQTTTAHPFVRSIMAGDGKEIRIAVAWRTSQDQLRLANI